jgi:hypothetical protein
VPVRGQEGGGVVQSSCAENATDVDTALSGHARSDTVRSQAGFHLRELRLRTSPLRLPVSNLGASSRGSFSLVIDVDALPSKTKRGNAWVYLFS